MWRYTFVALLAFIFNTVSPIHVIHEENVCIWYDQCKKVEAGNIKFWYNCLSNKPSVLIADNSYAYDVLSEVCPWYINAKPNSTRVCCSVSQMNTLRSAVKQLPQYFGHCPSCFRNFMNMLCAVACDPSNSLFMNVRNFWIDNHTTSGIPAIELADVYFTNDYINKFFNSCKDTVFSQGRGKAIDRYCCDFYDCSPFCYSSGQGLVWLIGLNAMYGSGLNFTFTDYTSGGVIPKNMSAHNGTIVNCDQPIDGVACSFSNCPATCPVPPDIRRSTGSVKVTSILLGIFVSFVMYNVVFTILIIVYLCFTGSSTKGSIQINVISRSLILKNDVGYRFELLTSRLFSKWGCIAETHWVLVVSIALILQSVCCAGLMFLDEATDPIELWSGPDSRASKEKEYFEKHFGPVHRTSQIIITAPNSSNFSFTDPQYYERYYHFGGIFQQVVLNEIWFMQSEIMRLRVPVKAANGTEYNITLNDICYKPLYPRNKKCKVSSVLNYFQNDYQLLNKHIKPLFEDIANSSYHIHYCNKDPYSLNDSVHLKIPCLAEYGGPIDPTIALGGYSMVNGSAQYDLSKAIIITFYINNYIDEEQNNPAEQWEAAFVNYLKNYKNRVKNSSLEFSFTPANFIPLTEFDHGDLADVQIVATSYSLMFLYIVLFMGGIVRHAVYGLWDNKAKHSSIILVSSRIVLGVLGVILIVLSVAASIGLLSYFRIKTTLIIAEVVPFFVLAVGTNNLFILTHAYERKQRFTPGAPVSQIMSDALGEVGPSILLTSLTETVTILLGVISTVPAVRTFSLFAGSAVLINFLLQISVFVVVLGLDSKRMAGFNFNGYQLTKTKKDNHESILFLLMRKYYAPFLLHKYIRILVLYTFGMLFFGMLLVVSNKDSGSNVSIKQSSSDDYIKDVIKYSKVGLPVYFVIKDGLDYSNEDNQNKICFEAAWCGPCNSVTMQIFRASQIPEHSKIAKPALNWLDSYFEWINPLSGCCMVLDRKVFNNTRCSNQSDPMCQPCLSDPTLYTYHRPDANEFMHYLPWFLNESLDNTITKCSQGYNTVYHSAVDYVDQNKTIEGNSPVC
ncbi:NPC intracellular cholesterol transporter 1-like isoform X3 [Dysidea avara]|uniref:NPC intracellular cholesterol transporter 1-like isoform X3 n=1 Tax=Dysidea avara TaxID=196820 RepID=UPI0033195FBA